MDLPKDFLQSTKNKNLLTVFYECGSGGSFLLFLLGMHYDILARDVSMDPLNKYMLKDTFGVGRGLEENIDKWHLTEGYQWYLARDHANLLYPTNNWHDKSDRTYSQGIIDFNNIYYHYWKQSKTIWIGFDNIEELQELDRLGAIKNFGEHHVHLSSEEYKIRYDDLKSRLAQKMKNFDGNYIIVNYKKLWHTDSANQLKRIADFLKIDADDYLPIWLHLIRFWRERNSKICVCTKEMCFPKKL